MKSIILMDLDGTLTDSSEGIINSINYAVKKLKLTPLDSQTLNSFIGPPLADSFRRVYQMGETETENAVATYREYFTNKGMKELDVYEGIPEILEALARNHDLYIATSKPEIYAKEILQTTGLVKYFKDCFGADLAGKRGKKDQVIAYALKEIKPDSSKVIMIGDRDHDINGAKSNGLQSIGVLYGYGDENELRNADRLAKMPKEILIKAQELLEE